jgi:hypothetical protein
MLAEDHAHDPAQKHTHAHSHAHPSTSHGAAKELRDAAFSLLRLSAAQRLGIVLVVILGLWAGVRWALS